MINETTFRKHSDLFVQQPSKIEAAFQLLKKVYDLVKLFKHTDSELLKLKFVQIKGRSKKKAKSESTPASELEIWPEKTESS